MSFFDLLRSCLDELDIVVPIERIAIRSNEETKRFHFLDSSLTINDRRASRLIAMSDLFLMQIA
jgi:hypothetical protein